MFDKGRLPGRLCDSRGVATDVPDGGGGGSCGLLDAVEPG